MIVLLAFFIALSIFSSIHWLARYVSCAALLYYIEKNGYRLPTDNEIKECTDWANKQIVKELFKGH